MHPNAQRSLALQALLSVRSSGLTYSAVPTNELARLLSEALRGVFVVARSGPPEFRGGISRSLAVPKSVILTCLWSSSNTFSGFKSRCITPLRAYNRSCQVFARYKISYIVRQMWSSASVLQEALLRSLDPVRSITRSCPGMYSIGGRPRDVQSTDLTRLFRY